MPTTNLPFDYDQITYPPTPWRLKGETVQSISLIDTDRARQFVPPELEIVQVLPGKTLGGVYLASYEAGSTLVYNELAIFCATTRYAGKKGFWISHIYVDEVHSLKSGPEMWGWPKEMAQFVKTPGKESQVVVRQDDKILCTINYKEPWLHWKQCLTIPAFGSVAGDIRWFEGKGNTRMGISGTKVHIPEDSPFNSLNLHRHIIALKNKEMDVTFDGIQVMGHRQL
ncbi:MAG: acetoacetate decarboxylase family protein [Clostridia bacterium]|nr:acetoacetate decarboxylase family protein [Clostridia bacterium]